MSKLTRQTAAADEIGCAAEKISLTVAEAAEQMSVSRPTILSWVHRADGLPHFYAGRKILIPRQSLVNWATRQADTRAVL